MNSNRLVSLLAMGVCGISLMAAGTAMAQTQGTAGTTEVKEETITINRIRGTFSAGKVTEAKYTAPQCPAVVFDIDAQRLEATNDKAEAQAIVAKLPDLKKRFQAWEDCMINNAKLDNGEVFEKFKNSFDGPDLQEVEAYQKLLETATISRDRILELTKKKKNLKVEEADFVSNWQAPKGRTIGQVSAGDSKTLTYTSGCGVYLGEVTAAHLEAAQTPKLYEQLANVINLTSERRTALLNCRNENTGTDFNDLAKNLQAGFDATYKPAAEAYYHKLGILEHVIEVASKKGGTLAPKGVKKK